MFSATQMVVHVIIIISTHVRNIFIIIWKRVLQECKGQSTNLEEVFWQPGPPTYREGGLFRLGQVALIIS